jgi:hypothetical protein
MRSNRIKKVFAGAAFALVLLLGGGMITGGTAQAQVRDRHWDRDDHRDRNDRRWDNDRDRGRDWRRDRDWDRDRRGVFIPQPRVYTYPRVYTAPRPNGYYYPGSVGRYGYSGAEQQGYNDGLNRGREDARDGRSFNPNNSSHFRSGSAVYRDGFRRGYEIGYREFAGYRRW